MKQVKYIDNNTTIKQKYLLVISKNRYLF